MTVCTICLTFYVDIDFFEYGEKDSDVGPSQNLVQQPQQSWEEVGPVIVFDGSICNRVCLFIP